MAVRTFVAVVEGGAGPVLRTARAVLLLQLRHFHVRHLLLHCGRHHHTMCQAGRRRRERVYQLLFTPVDAGERTGRLIAKSRTHALVEALTRTENIRSYRNVGNRLRAHVATAH